MAAKSDEEIKQFWNHFANNYETSYQYTSDIIFQLSLPLLDLKSSTSILEAGCGAGTGLQILRSIVPASVKIFSNDISEEMVSKAQSKNIENTEIQLASNESLPFPNECCNKYISNLTLHIVNDAKKMLAESLRVLQPGGSAVFTVWGKAEDSNLFTTIGRAVSRCGISSKSRSPFYLNNMNTINNLLSEAGFVNVKSFYTAVPLETVTVDEFMEYIKGMPEIYTDSEEKNAEITKCIREEAQKIHEAGKAFTFDALVVYGRKPN